MAGLVNLFAFSCIPAQYLAYSFYVLTVNLVDLINVAAANNQIAEIRSLYLDASRELHELRRRAINGSNGPDMTLIKAMDVDAEVLGSYLDVDRYRFRLLGLVVTFGMLRTLIVTLLTLIVGLWSILRGLGVFLTLESLCPFKTF